MALDAPNRTHNKPTGRKAAIMKTTLTDRTIRAAKPTSSTYDISDAPTRGLRLRVTPTGTKSWTWRIGRRRVAIGRWPGIGLAEARRLAGAMSRAADLGEDPELVLRPPPADTLAAAIDRWQMDAEQKGARRAHDTASAVRYHFRAYLDRPLTELTRRAIRDRVEAIRNGGHPAAANRALSRLRTVLAFAHNREMIQTNPATGIERPARERSEEADLEGTKRALSVEELARVWRAAEQIGSDAEDVFKLLILTACRRSEIGGLRWSEIDFDRRLITIPGSRMKAGREHVVPLSDPAFQILDERVGDRRRSGDFVFSRRGNLPWNGWKTAVPKVRRFAKLDRPWVVHALRRSVATGMVEHLDAGGDLIARVLAHTAGARIGSVTALYERSKKIPARAQLMKQWADFIEQFLAGGTASNVVTLRQATVQ
jgi:integrase